VIKQSRVRAIKLKSKIQFNGIFENIGVFKPFNIKTPIKIN
jgi:hypothetical protein